MTRSARWTAQADAWAAWADGRHEDDVLPPFFALLPDGARKTLDIGCGEGRLTRELRRRGCAATGVDVAPRLVELARARDVDGDYRVAAAEELPFEDASFDLVVAFNVLMNVDDPARAIEEAGRVLTRDGHLCASIVHPIASAGTWDGDVFLVHDYLRSRPHEERVGDLVFANVHFSLEMWSRWLEDAGFVIEALREIPRPHLRGWNRLPMFLYVRARR
ncbi:MAG TPA: class I SAM-dependent methyltransferase [Gaiellaceae bacterium]|nr:class I SAM-dependent methyltransferase [Gaiellaceae bacterium]